MFDWRETRITSFEEYVDKIYILLESKEKKYGKNMDEIQIFLIGATGGYTPKVKGHIKYSEPYALQI